MHAEIFDDKTDKFLRDDYERVPKCGVDFCDRCGDCLHCYDGDGCYPGGGDHRWIIYIKSEEA